MDLAYQGIVFDLDGTLVDSAPVVADVLNEMRQQLGLEKLDIECYRAWSSEGGATLVGNALSIPVKDAEPLLPEFRRRYSDFPTPTNSVYTGVIEMLQKFKSLNIRLGICSNKPENLCKKVLSETNLTSYFDIVLGGDSLPKKKPNPLPLTYVINEMKLATNSVLYVGDSSIDKATAKAANIDFAFFVGGYDPIVPLDKDDIKFSSHALLVQHLISQKKIRG